jgi:hypothetical protein
MRKSFTVLAFVFCGFFCAPRTVSASTICSTVASNLVANCGFETGTFSSWTIGGNTLDPNDNYYGVDSFDANSGSYGAYMSQDLFEGTTPVTLSQTLATTVGDDYTVEFWLKQDTAPTKGYTHAFSASWDGTTFLSLTPTVAAPGVTGVFTEYTFSEIATGPSTTLSFSFENDDNYWSFDDVSVAAVPVSTGAPEPSTGLLIGIAISLVLLVRSRCAAIR